jgi:mannose-6-phosphate isomerase-like protein (cupin superfamily)
VGAGDAILIPVGEVHCLHNVGDDDLALLCPVSPPSYPEDYHAVREELDE